MKQKMKKKTGRILGGVFLFALVIGMLVVPYMTDGEGKVKAEDDGWSQYFNNTPAPNTGLTYTASEEPLVINVSLKSGNYIRYSVDGEGEREYAEKAASGTHKVTYKVYTEYPSGSVNSVYSSEFPVTIAPARPRIKTTPQSINSTYDGNGHNLVSNGAVEMGNDRPFPDGKPEGTLMYQAVKEGDSPKEGAYSDQIPVATNAGIYTIWYKVEPNQDMFSWKLENCTATTPASVTATIARAPQGAVTAPAVKTGLKYNGTAQELIIPGLTDPEKGTMKYKLDNGEYSTEIPKAKDVGTYTICYKVEGKDGNYEDIPEKSIQVTIDKGSSTAGGGTTTGGTGGGGGSSSTSSSSGSSSSSTSTTPAPQVPEKEDERGVHTVIKSSDGSVTDVWTKTEKDGSTTEIRKTTHPDGTVTETEIKISADRKHIVKVQVIYDKQGRKIDTSIEFSQQKDSTLMNINLASLKSLLEKDASGKILGGAKVIFNLTDDDGTEKFTVTLDSSLLNEKELAIFSKERNGDLVMVQKTFTCTITEDGEMSLNIPEKGNYQLVSTEEARNLGKEILSSIKPLKEEASLKIGESINFKMSKDCNQNNILKITYKVKNNKGIKLKVNKNGKITLKETSGDSKTITVTAKVKLKDGTIKKIKMKINV